MRIAIMIRAVSVLALAMPVASHAQASDPGARAFQQCRACHSVKPGEPNRVGPNLNKMFGARAGTVSKTFKSSPALVASGIVWDEKTLDAWIASPAALVKGNRMAYVGNKVPETRAAIIAYLKRETK